MIFERKWRPEPWRAGILEVDLRFDRERDDLTSRRRHRPAGPSPFDRLRVTPHPPGPLGARDDLTHERLRMVSFRRRGHTRVRT